MFNEEYLDSKLLTKQDVEKFAYDYIEHNKLDKQVNNISFTCRDNNWGNYSQTEKTISLNHDLLLSYLEDTNKNNDNKNIRINLNYIKVILHELKHANQMKTLQTRNKNVVIINALNESFEYVYSKLYDRAHDKFIIEYNADLESLIELNNLLNKFNSTYRKEITDEIYKKLSKYYILYDCPLKLFNILSNNPNTDYYDNYNYNKISLQDRILYGLPIKKSEIKKIKELKKHKEIDMYKHF